jgi:hypothetical protein
MSETVETGQKMPRYERPAITVRREFETRASGGCMPAVTSGSYCCSGHWDSDHQEGDKHKKRRNCG